MQRSQGTDFHLIPREGFGWCVPRPLPVFLVRRSRSHSLACRTNSSYQVGLSIITQFQRRALGALTPPDSFFRHGRVLST